MEMKDGLIKTVTYRCEEVECQECERKAVYKHTFLLRGARENPNSSAYGKDDCSWCEDDCIFSCEEHEEMLRRHPRSDYSWCATFPKENFKHMFFEWKKISEELTP